MTIHLKFRRNCVFMSEIKLLDRELIVPKTLVEPSFMIINNLFVVFVSLWSPQKQ